GRPFWLDGREGRKISDLLWAIYRSAREHRPVAVRADAAPAGERRSP
ncbi:hypothetical protein HQ576_10575, partial [bacterium]|nr:hypothetical protein [bacterium]